MYALTVFLTFIYFMLGTLLGMALRGIVTGHGAELIQHPWISLILISAEALAFLAWSRLKSMALAQQPMQTLETPFQLLRGLPVTTRIKFLLVTTVWLIGLVLGAWLGQ